MEDLVSARLLSPPINKAGIEGFSKGHEALFEFQLSFFILFFFPNRTKPTLHLTCEGICTASHWR